MSFACVALSAEAIAQTPQKVFRFVPQYESTVLDPVTSILQVTHQAALLPYDTLMARDAANEVRPQMLESYRLDPSQRIYTMVLRPNLRFHDGSLVRAVDVSCVAPALGPVATMPAYGCRASACRLLRSMNAPSPSRRRRPRRWCCSRCPRHPTRHSSCANATR
jgi:hypothetical protein